MYYLPSHTKIQDPSSPLGRLLDIRLHSYTRDNSSLLAGPILQYYKRSVPWRYDWACLALCLPSPLHLSQSQFPISIQFPRYSQDVSNSMKLLLSPPLRMGAIAVSGKILCLSVTHFCVACHSATVGEIDTKPVLYTMQHL